MFIKRTLRIPSLTLTKDDLKNLKLILDKTGKNPTFQLDTGTEEIEFNDFEVIAKPNWPANIKQLRFGTGYTHRTIRGFIDTVDMLGLSNITLEDSDRDWISARTEELKQFLNQHHNWHYFFHRLGFVIAQGLLLVALLDYWFMTQFFIPQDLVKISIFPVLATAYGAWYVYGFLLPRVFPFLVLQPEHPSFITKLRGVFKYLMPAIFVGLFVQLILNLI